MLPVIPSATRGRQQSLSRNSKPSWRSYYSTVHRKDHRVYNGIDQLAILFRKKEAHHGME